MKKNILMTAAAICLSATAACAPIMPTYEIGTKPTNYEQRAIEYIKTNLKDPDSMKNVSVGAIRDGVCNSTGFRMGPMVRGWVLPVSYNATNSYGGYVGQSETYVWFQNDRIVGSSEDSSFCPGMQ